MRFIKFICYRGWTGRMVLFTSIYLATDLRDLACTSRIKTVSDSASTLNILSTRVPFEALAPQFGILPTDRFAVLTVSVTIYL